MERGRRTAIFAAEKKTLTMENLINQDARNGAAGGSDVQETLYQESTNQSTETNDSPKAAQPETSISKRGKQRSGGDSAVATGVGSLAGAAAGVVVGAVINEHSASAESVEESETEAEQEASTSENSSIVDDSMQIATTPNDDMSFSEAFAAARAEVGPGGVFEWHGGLYGTYYASEWNSMTPEEKNEYNSHFSWHNASAQDSAPDYAQGEPELVEDDEDVEVQVLSVETVSTDYGNVDVATLDVDGDTAYFVDLDQDGQADVGIMDFNNDGVLTEDELVDMRGSGVVMPYAPAPGPDEDLFLASNDGTDYMNDADVDEYLA